MTEYTFQLESDFSFAVVVCKDYRRALDIVRSTLMTDLFWLVGEAATPSKIEGISFLEAE